MVFTYPNDQYVLNGEHLKAVNEAGRLSTEGFEKIGKNDEEKPLLLNNYLSYDEMQISALL